MLVYGSFALVVWHWIPFAILAWVWGAVFAPNMCLKEASLSRRVNAGAILSWRALLATNGPRLGGLLGVPLEGGALFSPGCGGRNPTRSRRLPYPYPNTGYTRIVAAGKSRPKKNEKSACRGFGDLHRLAPLRWTGRRGQHTEVQPEKADEVPFDFRSEKNLPNSSENFLTISAAVDWILVFPQKGRSLKITLCD
ncbi:MAG: hypothetical protein EBW14_15440 [Oxalobacteraceae bacterium]|nr:hypothetical protein [Oxalobacteraceae bacterium]